VQEPNIRQRLATNLRRLRVARHLSLSALARATAMSKATLSGIERGHANPTVDTLAALAGALEVPIADLLAEADESEILIVRSSQANRPSDRIGAHLLETVSSEGPVEFTQIFLPARHAHEEPPRPAGTRRHVLVIDGTLIAGPVDRISELAAGDYASFPADVPHVYEAPRGRARAVVVTMRLGEL
jgi:XRE family transcriptional regulator, regulator of sulfur utilization